VVLKDGERGARIFPKGCQVRNRVVGGVKRKVDKKGAIKPTKKKVKVTGDSFNVHVKTKKKGYVKLMYDTGATDTTVNISTAHKLGLVTQAKGTPKPVAKYQVKTQVEPSGRPALQRHPPDDQRDGSLHDWQRRHHAERPQSVRRAPHAWSTQILERQIQIKRRAGVYLYS
jgi:hypothetical protein